MNCKLTVVGEGAAVLKLLSSEDKTLLVGRDALLVLNLRLDVVNRVRRLDLECDGLAGEGLTGEVSGSGVVDGVCEALTRRSAWRRGGYALLIGWMDGWMGRRMRDWKKEKMSCVA